MIWERAPMNRLVTCAVGCGLFFCSLSKPQQTIKKSQDILVQVVDGRNGKPLAQQRVLVFTGLSSEAAQAKTRKTEVTTNKSGVGTLTIELSETQWLQVFVDFRTLCYPNPNRSSFSVSEIISTGVATANNCGGLTREPRPGHFIVFARPASFSEKMAR